MASLPGEGTRAISARAQRRRGDGEVDMNYRLTDTVADCRLPIADLEGNCFPKPRCRAVFTAKARSRQDAEKHQEGLATD